MPKVDNIHYMKPFEIKKTIDEDGTEHAQVIMKDQKPDAPADKKTTAK